MDGGRKIKSKVWTDFTIVKVVGGVQKTQCNYCKRKLLMGTSGAITHLHRHLSNCLHRRGKQRTLAFESIGFGSEPDATNNLTTYKYEKNKVREIMAKMVLVHEYPFRMVDHELFIVLLKVV